MHAFDPFHSRQRADWTCLLRTLKWTPIFEATVVAAHFVHGDVILLGISRHLEPAPGAVDFVMVKSSTCCLRTRKQEVLIVSTFECLFLTNVCCAEGRKYSVLFKVIAKILKNISLRDKREEFIFKHKQTCRRVVNVYRERCLQPVNATYYVMQDWRRFAVFSKYSLSILWLHTD